MANKPFIRNGFMCWLYSKNMDQLTVDDYVLHIEAVSVCYSKFTGEVVDLWAVTDPEKLHSILQIAFNGKSKYEPFPIIVSKTPLLMLEQYVSGLKSSKTRNRQESNSSIDKQQDYSEKLEDAISYLMYKYSGKPAETLKQVQKENPHISVVYINEWTRTLFNLTASEYLIKKGIIEPKIEDDRDPAIKLAEITERLKQKYLVVPAKSLAQIFKENPDLSAHKVNGWTKQIYGITTKEYFTKEGIISEGQTKDSWRNLQQHTKQPVWDKYETALLVDACCKILYEGADKKAVIKNLSFALRSRAIHQGMKIDDIFRNENGIALQMTKIMYLLTDGAQGMPGAGTVYCEVAILKKESPRVFNQLLKEALQQLQDSRSILDNDDALTQVTQDIEQNLKQAIYDTERDAFRHWLIVNYNYKKEQINSLISIIDDFSNFALEHDYSEKSFWVMKDVTEFVNVYTRLLNVKNFRVDSNRRLFTLKRALQLYARYLTALCDEEDLKSGNDYRVSVSIDYTNDPSFDLLNGLLSETVGYLKSRYEVKLIYDRFKKPTRYKNDLLYKIYRNGKDILWVYFIFKERSRYISLECEPEYLTFINDYSLKSDKIKIRVSHPCQKMFYYSNTDILLDVVEICDSIERYFDDKDNGANSDEDKEYYQKLYAKLYSVIKDIDCSDRVSLHQLCDLIGESDSNLVAEILNNAQWAIEVCPGYYSSISSGRINDSVSATESSYEKDKYINVLLNRFRNGMSFDSIDYDIFRETYSLLYDQEIDADDSLLEKQLKKCGVVYKNRLFPAEGLIDNDTKERLFSYINSSFSSGKKAIYYRALFEELADLFVSCYSLNDEIMLRKYIEYVSERGEYYFYEEYFTKEVTERIDLSLEIAEYLLSSGKPMSIEDISSKLSHIPKDHITYYLRSDKRFVWNSKGEYFHIDIFEINSEESSRIESIISSLIEDNGFAIWNSVWKIILDELPEFVENNMYLSSYGIRNACELHYANTFIFIGQVISLPKCSFDMKDIYQMFAKHHSKFTAKELYELSQELEYNIYLSSVLEVSVRVNGELFVSKNDIEFNVPLIDEAIESFMSKDYIRIREIDSFLSFPYVGYEWNEFLLESFVLSFSKKFKLVNNGVSMGNVAGAIVKLDGKIIEFVDVCADFLANSHINLDKASALEYLASNNMITRRSYKDVDKAIQKAKQIRERQK